MEIHELEVDSVLKNFNGAQILSDVYLKCRTGEVIGLLGRNGCGKSTLLEIIFGTLDTYHKNIRINKHVYPYPYQKKNLIAFLPQKSFLPKHIPLKTIVRVFLSDPKRRESVLNDKRIKAHLHKSAVELSGGQRRYFEILLLINLPAKFVLLDEPFSAIEPLYKEVIKKLIVNYKSEKGFIITDHDYKNVLEISDDIFLLVNGACRHIDNLEKLEAFNYLPRGTLAKSTNPVQEETETTEKPFQIDEQSRKDLDLLDIEKEGSLYAIFDNAKSKGGKSILARIFKSPVCNLKVLEERRDFIRYFQENKIELNIDKKQLDFVEYYITSSITLSRNNYLDSFFSGIQHKYKPSNDYYIIKTGIQNTIDFLKYFSALISKFLSNKLPEYLSVLLFKAQELINKPEIRKASRQYEEHKKLLFKLGEYDFLFRKIAKNDILELLNIIYELEAYWSVSITASRFKLGYPEYSSSPNSKIEIEGLFHPRVKNAISNDFAITYSNNLCFLTGANMSGKSTFLKSLGISIYLAHLGFPVPARCMKTTVFNGMITTINLSDNINKGYSHFYSEVKRVKKTALEIKKNKKMVVIFDELFRGTNVKDASDASLMIISGFSKIQHSLFLVSTHIIEIAPKLKEHQNIFFTCFNTNLQGEKPIYSYKLKKGVSKESLGLLIVKNEKIAEILEEVQNNPTEDKCD